jgi:hypothetical protein
MVTFAQSTYQPSVVHMSRSTNLLSSRANSKIARFSGLKAMVPENRKMISSSTRCHASRAISRQPTKVVASKVAVLGGAGGIGQPLALLLKMNPMISELAVYDVAPITPGVAADLSHINTPSKVTAFTGPEELAGASRVPSLWSSQLVFLVSQG